MATVTWTGGGADTAWGTGLNWDTTTVPATGDDVVFDGAFPVTGSKNCTAAGGTLNSLTVTSGYTGNITQGSTFNVTNAGTKTITFNGTGTWDTAGESVGCAILDASGSATKTITLNASAVNATGDVLLTGSGLTLNAGTSTLRINGTSTWSLASGLSLYKVDIGPAGNAQTTLGSSVSITNNLRILDGKITAGANTLTLGANFQKDDNFTANTSTVIFNGTSTVIGSITFYNLTINSGKTVHLTSGQTFTVSGAFVTSGTSTLDATIGGSRANLNVNGSQSVVGVTATDIDSSGGSVKPINNVGGTNSNTVQWDLGLTTESVITEKRKLRNLLGVGL